MAIDISQENIIDYFVFKMLRKKDYFSGNNHIFIFLREYRVENFDFLKKKLTSITPLKNKNQNVKFSGKQLSYDFLGGSISSNLTSLLGKVLQEKGLFLRKNN